MATISFRVAWIDPRSSETRSDKIAHRRKHEHPREADRLGPIVDLQQVSGCVLFAREIEIGLKKVNQFSMNEFISLMACDPRHDFAVALSAFE